MLPAPFRRSLSLAKPTFRSILLNIPKISCRRFRGSTKALRKWSSKCKIPNIHFELSDHSRRAPHSLEAVQVEGLVVMKIIKNCSAAFPNVATGGLVGLDVSGGLLEVTNSFPFPAVDVSQESHLDGQAVAPRAKSSVLYQENMLKMFREVSIDSQSVGWYTSANMGNFCNANFVENQYHFQKDLGERAVALVNDISRSSQGGALSLRAFRLSPQFMAAFKETKFTTEK